ncbi:MAG: AAA family ATPase [Gemmatimonadales bacterium]
MALLVYLAVDQRQSHERSTLVELLWPRAAPDRGRHSCATALSLLRGLFGRNAIVTSGQSTRFAPANLQIDLDRLEKGDIVGPEGDASIDVDGFLRGFDIDDAPEFSLWKEREQTRRQPSIHAAILTLIDHGRRRGSHDEIMSYAERLLALDHLAEEGIRAKMEALALVGDRVSALRAFDEWKDQLHREVGAEPSALVDRMASQLRRRGWESQTPAIRLNVPTDQWRDRPFVGRTAEYRKLYENWETVHQFRPGCFLIAGDSGIGKTTLVQRLATAASLEAASVSRVQCYRMERHVAYAAVGSLVAGLVNRPGFLAAAPRALALLATIAPSIRQNCPTLPPPTETGGESARLLLAESLVDLLEAMTAERPALLVVDDAHYADDASLATLHLAFRRLTDARALFVATLLAGNDRTGPIRQMFGPVAGAHLDLGPLRPSEATDLLLAIVGDKAAPPSPTEIRAMSRSSGGSPMALELIADDWLRHGRECGALALNAFTSDDETSGGSFVDASEMLFARLAENLSPNAKQALTLAAILGRHLGHLAHYELVGLPMGRAIDGLSELRSRRVLRDVGGELEFVNEVVRAAAYRSAPATVRQQLHAAVAEQLEAMASEPKGLTVELDIAWHLFRAHQPDRAAGFLLSGARKALVRGAADDVVLSIRSCIDSLASETRVEAGYLLVRALHEGGYWREGNDAIHAYGNAQSRFRILAVEGSWRAGQLTEGQVRDAIQELLEIAESEPRERSVSLTVAAFLASGLNEDKTNEQVTAAIANTAASTPAELATLLVAKARLLFQRRRLIDGEQAAIEARLLLDRLGVTNTQSARLDLGLAAFRIAVGDYESARTHLSNAITMAKRLDNETLLALARANAALVFLRIGNHLEAIEAAKLVTDRAEPISFEMATYARAAALASLGQAAEAVDVLERADRVIRYYEQAWIIQAWLLHSADTYWIAGHRAKAIDAAATATQSPYHKPLSRAVAGPFSRWKIALSTERPRGRAPAAIRTVLAEWEYLDALDQQEIVFAAELADCVDLVDGGVISLIKQGAARLPQSAMDWTRIPQRALLERHRAGTRR